MFCSYTTSDRATMRTKDGSLSSSLAFRVPIFTTVRWTGMMMLLRKWSDRLYADHSNIPLAPEKPPHWILPRWINSEVSLFCRARSPRCPRAPGQGRLKTIVMSERGAGTQQEKQDLCARALCGCCPQDCCSVFTSNEALSLMKRHTDPTLNILLDAS